MNIIAAVDNNWAIGYKNQLLVNIPADMRFFRDETMGKVVVMGRKTLDSLPNHMPLAGRKNIVLTHNKSLRMSGVTFVYTLDQLMQCLREYQAEAIYVIGGGEIYKTLLPFCSVAHITKINYQYQADTYFPNLDEQEEWEIVGASEEQTYYDLEYEHIKYQKKVPSNS